MIWSQDLTLFGELTDIGAGRVGGGIRERIAEPITKDEITSKLVPDTITECSLGSVGDVCSSAGTLAAIQAAVGASSPQKAMQLAKEKLGCQTERCVIERSKDILGEQAAQRELMLSFKIKGPIDCALLSDTNIDTVMQQWAAKCPNFWAYNFNMLNYASFSFRKGKVLPSPDTLATVRFEDLYLRGYRCAACVINSDVYQGAGKHWMALFADARDASPGATWSVEFFNSSGNGPAPEWVNWMHKTRDAMEKLAPVGVRVEIVRVSRLRHQDSRSECGVYSLFYIWGRLNGVPYDYFAQTRISDKLMMEFRHHLFETPHGMHKFEWDEFMKRAKIQWETH